MNQNQSVAQHPQRRQRKIDYGEESQRLITQLLVEVIHREREQEGGTDERED